MTTDVVKLFEGLTLEQAKELARKIEQVLPNLRREVETIFFPEITNKPTRKPVTKRRKA